MNVDVVFDSDGLPMPNANGNMVQKDNGYMPHQGYPKPGHGMGSHMGGQLSPNLPVYSGDMSHGAIGGGLDRRQVSPPLHINICGQVGLKQNLLLCMHCK